MGSLKLFPFGSGANLFAVVLATGPVTTDGVHLFSLGSVNQYAHSGLIANGLFFLLGCLVFKVNDPGALLKQISISSSEDHHLSLGNWAPCECCNAWPSSDFDDLPLVRCSIILLADGIHELRYVLCLAFSS
jgi:hypothetical protein